MAANWLLGAELKIQPCGSRGIDLDAVSRRSLRMLWVPTMELGAEVVVSD